VDARKRQSESSSSKSANSGSSFDDTSHYYHKVVVYADPTKKGTALSNEVSIQLESIMTTAGFDVSTLTVSLMGGEFSTEDDLVRAALKEVRANPAVSQNDYVAIALNSLTPVSVDTHRFTSKVTYRIIRIKDGAALLPAKDITGDSGEQAPSDDVARSYAVESAIRKVDEILPGEIRQALQKMQRAEKREAVAAATSYVIVVDNATALSTSATIRSALTAAGFKFVRDINGTAKVDTLKVTLNGKTGEDVQNTIEGAMDAFEIESMDNQSARVKAK
jgi:Arc/MetJ-type ribon-helix-helix transcriptional regulator